MFNSVRTKHTTVKYLMLGLASALLFGAATPASKALLSSIQAQTLAGLLYLGAAFIVLPAAIREQTFPRPWRAGRATLLLLTGAAVLEPPARFQTHGFEARRELQPWGYK